MEVIYVRACKNCGASYENVEDESWTWKRRLLSFLCPSCGATLVREAHRIYDPENVQGEMAALRDLVVLVKKGHKFKVSMLSPGLVWDGENQHLSPSPARRSVPSVRRIRKRYVEDGDYVKFCLDMDEAVKAYGVGEEDLIW